MRQTMLATLLGLAALTVHAASSGGYSGGGTPSGNAFDQARTAIEMGSYSAAISLLRDIAAERPDDPDVHNLLGYSHRQLGQYEQAEGHYEQALAIDPEHRGANEYLGELYLETGRPDLAEERLRVLDRACFWSCREYRQLEAALQRYRKERDG